jgi:hypothetical protein
LILAAGAVLLIFAFVSHRHMARPLKQASRQRQLEDPEGEYLKRLDRGLDEVISNSLALYPRSRHSMVFSGNHVLAYGHVVKLFSQEVLDRYADALREAGAGRLEIYPDPYAWLRKDEASIQRYDALISHMRGIGLGVVLAPEVFRGQTGKDFSKWQDDTLRAYSEMARRYRPEIFVVVHEPTTMAGRMGIRPTPGQWGEFVERAVRVVKEASPETRTAAGGQHYELPFIRQWLHIRALDTISINIYGLQGLPEYDRIIEMARARGKTVYIEETWRFPPQAPGRRTLEEAVSAGIGLEKYEDIDRKWLRAFTLYANARALEAITPFWTDTFFKRVEEDGNGLSYGYSREVAEAVLRGERTGTYDTYRELSGRYGAAGGGTGRQRAR